VHTKQYSFWLTHRQLLARRPNGDVKQAILLSPDTEFILGGNRALVGAGSMGPVVGGDLPPPSLPPPSNLPPPQLPPPSLPPPVNTPPAADSEVSAQRSNTTVDNVGSGTSADDELEVKLQFMIDIQTEDDRMVLIAANEVEQLEWAAALQGVVAKLRGAFSGELKQSEGTFAWLGEHNETLTQRPVYAEKQWNRYLFRMVEEPNYVTLAYFEHWDDPRYPTKLVGDFRLTPRVNVSGTLEMQGQNLPGGFTIVSPKKNVYFWADSQGIKDEWVRALSDALGRLTVRGRN
jgi:hypothetical protein